MGDRIIDSSLDCWPCRESPRTTIRIGKPVRYPISSIA